MNINSITNNLSHALSFIRDKISLNLPSIQLKTALIALAIFSAIAAGVYLFLHSLVMKRIIQLKIYILSGQDQIVPDVLLFDSFGGVVTLPKVSIDVDRGDRIAHNLDLYTYPLENRQAFDPTLPTVIVCHANAMVAQEMADHALAFRREGYQVVTFNLGGYPGSDPGVATSEISSYQDINAVIQYLKDQGSTDLILYGLSLGGTVAFAGAELHPDVVKVVIADQTFKRASSVAANVARNNLGRLAPACVVKPFFKLGFPEGEVVPGVFKNGVPYTTDGLNNARKAAAIPAEVIAIKSTRDFMMGKNRDKDGVYRDNHADSIMKARYNDAIPEGMLLELEGGHGTFFNWDANAAITLFDTLGTFVPTQV